MADQTNGQLHAYLNTGASFLDSSFPLAHTANALDRTQIDYQAIAGPTVGDTGNRGYRRRLIDLDNDGLTDILIFVDKNKRDGDDISRSHQIVASFNTGATFSDPIELPASCPSCSSW